MCAVRVPTLVATMATSLPFTDTAMPETPIVTGSKPVSGSVMISRAKSSVRELSPPSPRVGAASFMRLTVNCTDALPPRRFCDSATVTVSV